MASKKKRDGKQTPSSETKISLPKSIDVHYLKTSNYRTYHVDGVFGGLTPDGNIYIELFLQRAVTPKIIKYEVTKEGTLGKELDRESKKGLIREIEAGVIMNIEVAKVLRDWLDDKIKAFERTITEPVKKETK